VRREVDRHEGKETYPRAGAEPRWPKVIGSLGDGATIAELFRHFAITETTWHRWKNTYGGMKGQDVKRLKELEKENRRLKAIIADQALDIMMLKELAQGNL